MVSGALASASNVELLVTPAPKTLLISLSVLSFHGNHAFFPLLAQYHYSRQTRYLIPPSSSADLNASKDSGVSDVLIPVGVGVGVDVLLDLVHDALALLFLLLLNGLVALDLLLVLLAGGRAGHGVPEDWDAA